MFINPNNNTIKEIVGFLKSHEIVFFPVDTVYSIHAILRKETISKLIKIKQRDPLNPRFLLLAHNIEQLLPYIDFNQINESQFQTLNYHYEKPVSYVVPAKSGLEWLIGDNDTICVRLPHSHFVKQILFELNEPIISTSCNNKNHPCAKNAREAFHYFGDRIKYPKNLFPFVNKKPSSIINLITNEIIRD
jgi:tRNA threonylcarbamoyl adenosine modification protein (Sua5/YciO/YrdC/YwlC family)